MLITPTLLKEPARYVARQESVAIRICVLVLFMIFQLFQTVKAIVTLGAGVIMTCIFLFGPLTMADWSISGMLGVHVLLECILSGKLLAALSAIK